MKVLVVDDEKLARERLLRMLADIHDVQVVGEAGNGMRAVEMVSEQAPDVVLMDIRMPGMDGLEAARHIAAAENPPAIVFCTAYEEHAIDAFRVQAVGYLLKPVRRGDLETAMRNAQRTNRAQLAALNDSEHARRTHISARTRRGLELVPVDEVRYFQADQKYVTVRHGGGELLIDETLRDLEVEFEDVFVRIHRNALINRHFIEGLERDPLGHHRIRLRGIDERLEVSRRHVAGIRRFIQHL